MLNNPPYIADGTMIPPRQCMEPNLEEPATKKCKKDWSLKAVLGDDVTQPVPLLPVLTAMVKDKKATSSLVK